MSAAPDKAGLERLLARRRLGLVLTLIVLGLFYGFVLLMAFVPDLLGLGAPFSLGYALIMTIIVSVIALAIYYMRKTRTGFRDLDARPQEDQA